MPKWLNDAIFYEIYPQSFKDSNGDGIGDFNGIMEKLDYIKELGCNAIWMNPCFDSPFHDAGYDVRDYKKAAARYGSNEDLVHLFEEVHKRGMHILLDLVPGHTSEEHEWFKASGKAEPNAYSDRYIWTPDWHLRPEGMNYVAGECERNGVYVLNFFKCQPALNYGFLHPEEPWQLSTTSPAALATREAMKDVMRFWLDKGCDGFRVDMAESLVKNDDEKRTGTCAIWRDVRKMLDEYYPEAAIISEWNRPELSIPAGFHMDFCLVWPENGYSTLMRDWNDNKDNIFFHRESNRSILDFFDDYLEKYEKIKDIGRYCLITCNHDTTRPSHYLDTEELKLAYAFLFTMPGNPFVYYGDEIGMRYLPLVSKEGGYTRTGSRTPMQWDHTDNYGFSTADRSALYLPIDDDREAPTVESQKQDPDSLWHTVQKILSIRNTSEDLKNNTNLELLYAKKDERAFAFRRGSLLMQCNPSGEACVMKAENLPAPVEKVYEIGETAYADNAYSLGAQSFVIWKI